MTNEQMAAKLRDAGWTVEAPAKQPKWPGRVTSSTTECAHACCPDQSRCLKGCADQRPITWSDAPEIH